jgi:hypothetical protein
LAAYDEAHVRAVLGRHGFELEPTVRGTWRDLLTGSADPSRLREDAILARRSQASV